jgi:hypothetical protein
MMPIMSAAFARQAASDLAAYEILSSTKTALPRCHRLHYLQMWLEKLCKAHIHGSGLPVDSFTHGVIAKVFPRLVAQYWRSLDFNGHPNLDEITSLCREIDRLHPQVNDGGRREDNVEYPWRSAEGIVYCPAQYDFAVTGRLQSQPGKLLQKAAILLTRNPSIFLAS